MRLQACYGCDVTDHCAARQAILKLDELMIQTTRVVGGSTTDYGRLVSGAIAVPGRVESAVMAGLVPAIHGFLQRRGCAGQARA
jgi:hypothetical protein